MRKLMMIAACALPVAVSAAPTPIDQLDAGHEAPTPIVMLAAAPALPLGLSGDEGYCGQRLEPLPDVLTLYLDTAAPTLVALCDAE